MRIAVLMGGISGEREVSLASGVQVARALREAGHEAAAVDTSRGVLSPEEEEEILRAGIRPPAPPPDFPDPLRTGDLSPLTSDPRVAGADLIFPILHGGGGEDGTIQTLLDLAGLPYAGSDRVGCVLSMDKDLSKRLFRAAEIPTPDWVTTGPEPDLEEVGERLGFPLVVKPPSGGSTLGLTLVHDPSELGAAVETALREEERVLFERYVRGRELTVAVVGEETLPVGEIVPAHELFDYACKYEPGLAEEIFPAEISPALAATLGELALRAHRLLRLRDFSRVDFIVDEAGTAWCLEANALPGMTSNSLVPKAARAAGMPFSELVDRIVRLALERT